MDLKLVDPRITAKLLEGYADTITEAVEERNKFYQQQQCPYCGGNALTRTANPRLLFRPDDPLPRYQLRCQNCDCLFDPHTGIVLKTGNVGKAFVPAVPLLDGPDD